MRDPLSRAEQYRKLAVKYRELAKFAQLAYLGDFYRGTAVRARYCGGPDLWASVGLSRLWYASCLSVLRYGL
jgi:hypothetical protein